MTPTIPPSYVRWARELPILVVASANQGRKYRRRLAAGMGSESAPLRDTQGVEAAVVLSARAGRREPHFLVWGYGSTLDHNRTYVYEARGGLRCTFRAIGAHTVSTDGRPDFTRRALHRDARRLATDVASTPELGGRTPVMCVGCSWGGAVIDFALDATNAIPLNGIGIALGPPRQVLAATFPTLVHRLRPDGDYGRCWIRRHPDDPVCATGLKPLLYWLRPCAHEYWAESTVEPRPPMMWGI